MSEFKVMNNDEIRDFCIKKDLKIYELEKEIERLNNKVEELMKLYTSERHVKDYYKNIINELEKELDRGYRDLFAHELVPGRELITNIKNYLDELKGSDKE